jgi:hypothetical protein
MSQSGFTPIQLYRSSTAAAVPLAADLAAGELAINTTDEKLYFENASGVVKLLASSAATGGTFTTVTATTVVNGLGAVGTPSYTFTGDLNTGMWSPAADTIAFSEGGVEAMRISSSGFVGIGTTGPTTLLDVRGGVVGGNFSAISVDNSSGGSGSPANTVSVNFSNGGSVKASITSAVYGDGYMAFATNTNVEKMRIDSSGNVGIGTTAPAQKLAVVDGAIVAGGVGDVLIGRNSSGFPTSGAGTGYFKLRTINDDAVSGGIAIDTLLSGTLNERMRITAAGNVGVGVSAPTNTLTVQGTVAFNVNSTTDVYKYFTGGAGLVYAGTTTATAIGFLTSGGERMRLDTSGNALLGTTSSAGLATNTARFIGGIFATVRSSLAVASATPTTIVTLPSGDGIYIVSAALSASTDPANYCETAIVSTSGSNSSIAILVNAAVVSLTMSGLNLQVTQNQGATQTIQFSVLRIN